VGSSYLRDYEPLGGSSKCYCVRATGATISYRQFLKQTQQVNPEKRVAERKAAGLVAPRRPRKDKGISRTHPPLVSARKRRRIAPLVLPVSLMKLYGKQQGMVRVVWHGQPIGDYRDVGHGARHWQCLTCPLALREEASIIQHIYNVHRVALVITPEAKAATILAGGGRVLYTGDVRSGATRSRMPWRVAASEYK